MRHDKLWLAACVVNRVLAPSGWGKEWSWGDYSLLVCHGPELSGAVLLPPRPCSLEIWLLGCAGKEGRKNVLNSANVWNAPMSSALLWHPQERQSEKRTQKQALGGGGREIGGLTSGLISSAEFSDTLGPLECLVGVSLGTWFWKYLFLNLGCAFSVPIFSKLVFCLFLRKHKTFLGITSGPYLLNTYYVLGAVLSKRISVSK